MAARGRLRCSLPPTCAAPGGGEAPTARGCRSDRPAGCPSPAPRHGAECGLPRPRAAPGRGDWLPPSCEAVSCVPAAAAGAVPQVGARGPRGAKRKKKLAPSPGFPLRGETGSQNSVCGGSCWQSLVNAPATRVGAETLRYRSGLSGARQGPLALLGPAASSLISGARDPGLELCPHWEELLVVTRPGSP